MRCRQILDPSKARFKLFKLLRGLHRFLLCWKMPDAKGCYHDRSCASPATPAASACSLVHRPWAAELAVKLEQCDHRSSTLQQHSH